MGGRLQEIERIWYLIASIEIVHSWEMRGYRETFTKCSPYFYQGKLKIKCMYSNGIMAKVKVF